MSHGVVTDSLVDQTWISIAFLGVWKINNGLSLIFDQDMVGNKSPVQYTPFVVKLPIYENVIRKTNGSY